jgi:hypothetical protein
VNLVNMQLIGMFSCLGDWKLIYFVYTALFAWVCQIRFFSRLKKNRTFRVSYSVY